MGTRIVLPVPGRKSARGSRTFALLLLAIAPAMAQSPADYTLDLRTVLEHDDGTFLWFHPRACAVPGSGGHVVMTLQKHLQQSDYYSGLHVMHSRDGGGTWSAPDPRPELAWRTGPAGETIAVCDVTPGWHAPTGKLLAIGVKVRYRDGVQLLDEPQSHAAAYAVYEPKDDTWSEWKFIEMPDPAGKFFLTTPGCVQWLVEPDGGLLVPFYFSAKGIERFTASVMRCRFDGATMSYVEHGDELNLDVERGLVEPSLALFRGRYYLTLRNDVTGYVTTGTDGLHFAPIRPWIFDDGRELGSYNTQQHWVTHGDGLFLSYTRRGANNDHIMRHRAPLFMAQVDPETLTVIRSTERELMPERGATLGNFGVCNVSASESWVTDAEGIFSDDARVRGAKGATFIARILWKQPNDLAP